MDVSASLLERTTFNHFGIAGEVVDLLWGRFSILVSYSSDTHGQKSCGLGELGSQ